MRVPIWEVTFWLHWSSALESVTICLSLSTFFESPCPQKQKASSSDWAREGKPRKWTSAAFTFCRLVWKGSKTLWLSLICPLRSYVILPKCFRDCVWRSTVLGIWDHLSVAQRGWIFPDSDMFKVSTAALLTSRYMKQSKLQRLLLQGPCGKSNANPMSIRSKKYEFPVSFY